MIEHTTADVLFTTIIGVLTLVVELTIIITKRPKPTDNVKLADKYTLAMLWFGMLVAIFIGYDIMTIGVPADSVYTMEPLNRALVSVLFCIGLYIRIAAIFKLGKFFTVSVSQHKEHALVTTGIYSYIRHPSYLGLHLMFMALGFSMLNYMAVLVLIASSWALLNIRIKIEEAELIRIFGDEYRDYVRRTSAMVPFLK